MTDAANDGAVLVVGGSRAIGLEIAKHYAAKGHEVILTGRLSSSVASGVEQASAVVADGGSVRGLAFELAKPATIASALADVGPVRHLALVAIDRSETTVRDYDLAKAMYLVTMKLVGFTEVCHVLADRFTPDASIVLFGGMAKERPYAGSTTVTTVNAGIVGLARTLVEELRPIRVNTIHPGVVSDSPYWAPKEEARARFAAANPMGRLPVMQEVVDATVFLLENGAMNGDDLFVDCGAHVR
jgi:NAD(P)-dependent dehydrogenase (short-subunit alcohol dehydrogenase family)